MNDCITTGVTRRHVPSPGRNPADHDPMTRHTTCSAMLSATELRRLVAAMVD